MLTNLWTGLGGKLSERVVLALLSPATAFWAAGACAALFAHVPLSHWLLEIRRTTRGLTGAPSAVQLLVVLGLLALLFLSGRIVELFVVPVTRLLEGYWPRALSPVRRRLVRRLSRRRDLAARRWRELRLLPEESLGAEERAELIRLDRLLRRVPLQEQQRMPTRLGNVLRAGESRPVRKYGLDAVVCWCHLWLLLPDSVRAELGSARARLDRCVAGVIWGGLLLVWGGWTLWAIPGAVVVTAASYAAAVRAAVSYSDLVEAAWDLHRQALYASLRWPLPPHPESEYRAGRELTAYLLRGSRSTSPAFTSPP